MDQPTHQQPTSIPPTAPPPSAAAPAPASAPPAATAPPKRRRGWKAFKWTVLLLLLIVVGLGVIVYVNLNGIIERTVEKQATASTNLKTELGGASLSLFGGSLDLSRLEIASPAGFKAPHMLTLGDADVKVSFGELRQEPVRIASITLDKPKLVVERDPSSGQLNFKTAADRMPQTDPAPEPNQEPVKLVINDLTIRNASVVVRPGIPGLAEEFTVTIPTVNMKDIGSGEGAQNGAAIKDVVMQVITVLAAKASESGDLPDQLKQLMNVNLEQVVGQLGQAAQKRIAEAVPGELGQLLGNAVADPNAFLKDPGAVLKDGVEGKIGELLGGGARKPGDTQPATAPAADGPAKQVEVGLKGLLNRKKKE